MNNNTYTPVSIETRVKWIIRYGYMYSLQQSYNIASLGPLFVTAIEDTILGYYRQ